MPIGSRHWAVRVGAVLAVAAFGVGAPGPATADDTVGAAGTWARNATISLATSPGKAIRLSVYGERAGAVTVAIDTAGVSAVATVTTSAAGCGTAGTVITCELGSTTGYLQHEIPLTLRATATAASGDKGTVTVTTTATSAPTSVAHFTVTAADGVDLVAEPPTVVRPLMSMLCSVRLPEMVMLPPALWRALRSITMS